jgi:hypothetical protein
MWLTNCGATSSLVRSDQVPNRKLQHPYEIVKLERNEIVSHLFCAVNPNRVPPVAHVWVDRLLVLEVRAPDAALRPLRDPHRFLPAILAQGVRPAPSSCNSQRMIYDRNSQ